MVQKGTRKKGGSFLDQTKNLGINPGGMYGSVLGQRKPKMTKDKFGMPHIDFGSGKMKGGKFTDLLNGFMPNFSQNMIDSVRKQKGGTWYNNLGDFNSAIAKNQADNKKNWGFGKKQKGGAILKPILKKTKIISRGLKMIGAPGSPIDRFGDHMAQHGYGHNELHGRIRLN